MERLGHYRVVAPLGAGGMGEVYRAIDERLGRTVAIKLLHAADATSAQMQLRLLREAQAASALDHPGVVTVFDVGMHESRAYVVMEHVTGETFTDLAGKVEPVEALRLCADAADALAAAHDAGILHRDVKSDNLMRTRDGRVKVLDFGLAKLQDGGAAAMATSHSGASHAPAISEDASLDETMRPEDDPTISQDVAATLPASSARTGPELTQAGQLIGTPLYMSPEQAEREPVTARSEVYALGVVLYELLTGTVPFHGDDVPSTLEAIRTATLALPSQRRPTLPKVLDPLVAKALARRPTDRFDDMAPFATAMRAVVVELGGGGPRRWPWIALGAGLIGAGAVTAFALTDGDGSSPAEAPVADAGPRPASLRLESLRRLTALDGCEEFPSFTADGGTVVFDGARGKDYVLQAVDVATGAIRQVSDVSGWDWAGSVSPDGSQIVFIRTTEAGNASWVMGFDPPSPPRKLAEGTMKPLWSDNGKVWVGSVRSPVLIDLDGDHVIRKLQTQGGERYNGIAQLEDGRLAALVYDATAAESRGVAFLDDAGAASLVFPATVDEVLVPVPGGVLTSRLRQEKSELWFVPLHGTPSVVLGADDLQPRKGMDLSANGDLVWSTCETISETASLDNSAGGATQLRRISGGTWKDTKPSPLGTSRSLVVMSDRGGPTAVWIVDRDGVAAPRMVPTGDADPTDPAASPDGTMIAFASTRGGIRVVPVEGSDQPRALTTSLDHIRPTWSADGRDVYFEAGVDDQRMIMVVPLTGGAAAPVAVGSRPEASRDGKLLAYVDPVARVPVLRDLRTGKTRPLSKALASGPYQRIQLSADASRATVVLSYTQVIELDVATGRILRRHDTGGDQISGIAYVGDEIIVTRVIWQGDLWIAHGELVLPE